MSCWKLEESVAWGMGYLTTQNHANIRMRLQFGRKLDIIIIIIIIIIIVC